MGDSNAATGNNALVSNAESDFNTATGDSALHNNNTTGSSNTANGASALTGNTTGNNSTGAGVNTLFHNTTGSNNIALGVSAGENRTTGNNNIDIVNEGVAADAHTIRIGDSQTKTFIAGIREVTTSKAGDTGRSPLFEVALVLVRFIHVARCVVNANHGLRFASSNGMTRSTSLVESRM